MDCSVLHSPKPIHTTLPLSPESSYTKVAKLVKAWTVLLPFHQHIPHINRRLDMPDTPHDRKHLKRLPPEAYRGYAVVHWTHTIENRATGWLNTSVHSKFRELLIHTCARYQLACPTYCMMPDHLHLLLLGLDLSSDQRNATKFFKKHFNNLLAPSKNKLQNQSYDHVLRDEEASVDGFAQLAHYILCNPERANLTQIDESLNWPYLGAVVAGFPITNPFDTNFFPWFWETVENQRNKNPQ